MINRLIAWFRGCLTAHREFGRWLEKEHTENPFIVEGFNCLHFIQSMLATTRDPNIVASFTRLRQSMGSEHIGKLPNNSIEILCHLEYPCSKDLVNGRAFGALSMEQKWDIYLYDNRLYFCRSWTGLLVYVASCVAQDGILTISNIWGAKDIEKEYAIRQVDYLIKSHLCGHRVPHPLPNGLLRNPQVVALYSWKTYGNLCFFGTFEDTLPWNLLKTQEGSKGDK